MNKTALKNFAISARREMLERVELQARKLGITSESIQKANVESSDAIFIDGKQLLDTERRQRNKLIARINEIGFDRVMEETAYTWFNRLIALRYMEVNDYLPTKVRVLSSNVGSAEPDMMKEALSLDLELDKEFVYDLKVNNKTDELFKYLIKMHCNDLNRSMPFMFETIEDYTEILFPEGLLGTDSFVVRMTDTEVIPEDNWGKVEIIGWLYQYYISEENERVIQAKKRYKAEEIPFATQLFTPEWIVRYMVQNALGRYWIESYPEHRDLIENWEFYLENPNPEADFEEMLAPYINKEMNVEDIKCFDPAMGSGHILVYMFDVLHEIYSKCGYMEREIPRLIIEKNLYGLDIDDRAYQLASFSIIMKALQKNKRFLRSIERDGLTMNLASIQETNSLADEDVAFLAGELSGQQFEKMKGFIEQFKHAKAIGSLINIESYDVKFLNQRLNVIEQQSSNLFELEIKDRTLSLFRNLILQASIMDLKYDVLITNPPYSGSKYLSQEVLSYLAKNYPEVKSDLFSAFIEYSFYSTKKNGQIGMITPYVWMFLSSYESLRKTIVEEASISSLVQLEYNGFESAMVPVCIFTMRNYPINVTGEFIKLSEFKGVNIQNVKTLEAVKNPTISYRYNFITKNFGKIPGKTIAYWISDQFTTVFTKGEPLLNIGEAKSGLQTGNNNRFLRYWYEVDHYNIGFELENTDQAKESGLKWFPQVKGGSYRKWYGNFDYIVNYQNDGFEIRNYEGTGIIKSPHLYFKEGITWSHTTTISFGCRILPKGFIFNVEAPTVFNVMDKFLLIGLLNTKVIDFIFAVFNESFHYLVGDMKKIPILFPEDDSIRNRVRTIVQENILISKKDWDSFEVSWDFDKHPLLIENEKKIESAYSELENLCNRNFSLLQKNEWELNEIFIEVYKMKGEMPPDVSEDSVSIRKANIIREIKSFISYFVGCNFGRYSLDEEGLIFAGGKFDSFRYKTFPVNGDNILPILSGAYFEDDIVTRFIDFIKVTFSEETLEENLEFVTDVIGRKKNETAREALRRYFLNDFYKDHVQVYKKRPIYWLFTSGKEKAFNCLIYIHRYDKTTLSRIRTDYLHEVQIRMDAEKKDLLNIFEGDSSTKEISNAKKELKSLDKKIDELKAYDELLHHMADMQIEIDLDDGVVANYEQFKGLVAKIK